MPEWQPDSASIRPVQREAVLPACLPAFATRLCLPATFQRDPGYSVQQVVLPTPEVRRIREPRRPFSQSGYLGMVEVLISRTLCAVTLKERTSQFARTK